MKYHFTLLRKAIIKKKKKNVQKETLERVWRKGNPPTLLIGLSTEAATMEVLQTLLKTLKMRATL